MLGYQLRVLSFQIWFTPSLQTKSTPASALSRTKDGRAPSLLTSSLKSVHKKEDRESLRLPVFFVSGNVILPPMAFAVECSKEGADGADGLL